MANGEDGSRCYGYDRFVSESRLVSLHLVVEGESKGERKMCLAKIQDVLKRYI